MPCNWLFRDTLRNLVKHRFSCSVLEPLPNINRPADFPRLSKSFSMSSRLRPLAPPDVVFCQGSRISAPDADPVLRREVAIGRRPHSVKKAGKRFEA